MSLVREYVAASVNRYPNSCDWGSKFIAFASCNAVAIYDVPGTRITHFLTKHEAEVRCVRWIEPDETFVSASADKTAIIWTRNQDTFDPHFTLNHDAPLIVADSKQRNDGSFITVTSSTELMINIFKDSEKSASAEIKKYVFDLRLIVNESFWTTAEPVIIYSTDDSRVNIGVFKGAAFSQLLSLSGHEDWSRSIDYYFTQSNSLLLASASQDGFVRVWMLAKTETDRTLDIGEKSIQIGSSCFSTSLETVLAGHEGPVYCVKFVDEDCIVTASLDKTIIVWNIGDDDVWYETARVGEVGGNNMGFMGCTFPCHQKELTAFVGYSHNGALHVWTKNKELGVFDTAVGSSGHRNQVTDVCWEPTGKYLLSISSDETTRLHAKCNSPHGQTWHEIARPQIHGYEMNCVAAIDGTSFVTGADEKVVRVFRATRQFVHAFRDLTAVTDELDSCVPIDHLPLTSSVPALGLTNRAVYENNEDGVIMDSGDQKRTSRPPTEETLMQSTLWPEIHKLYGHGNELFAVAVNHKKTLIVSACKSAKAEHAGLICWNMKDEFKISQKLEGHQLTVTSIKFSPSDHFLVSVSRDRTWYLYRETEPDHYETVAFSDKKTCVHSRIIWDVSWTPDSQFFLTCSRDKKLVLWQIEETDAGVNVMPLLNHVLSQDHSVMSCDVLDRTVDDKFIVAFGTEDGSMRIFAFSVEGSWQPITLENSNLFKHDLSVRKIRFQPSSQESGRELKLASCSDDRSVQIFRISLPLLN